MSSRNAPPQQNVIGSHVGRLRREREMTQDALAAKCIRLGWKECGENVLSKVETGIRCVSDREILILARALKAKLRDLFPDEEDLF